MNIQYNRILLHTKECRADYGGDARPIRVHVEGVKLEEYDVQYNSNHA